MERQQIIKQLRDLAEDRKSFFHDDDEEDDVFRKDYDVLMAAVEILETPGSAKQRRLDAYQATGLAPAEVAELAVARRKGRLVEPPCKIGDTIYFVGHTGNGIRKAQVSSIEYRRNDYVLHFYNGQNCTSSQIEVEKLYFFDKAEAEAVLRERGEDIESL